jgi:hypothetical protein
LQILLLVFFHNFEETCNHRTAGFQINRYKFCKNFIFAGNTIHGKEKTGY